MDATQTNQTKRSEELQGMERSEVKFLREFFGSVSTIEERITTFALVDAALADREVAEAIRTVLWPDIEQYAEQAGWEAELSRNESVEAVERIHSILHFWRLHTKNKDMEKVLAERFNLPAEKVHKLGGLAAELLEQMLREQTEPKGTKVEKGTAGEPMLRILKDWLTKRSYTEKLCGMLTCELLSHEGHFEKPDNEIGQAYVADCRQAVINAIGDPVYLERASKEEIAVTAMAATMLQWDD